MWSTGVLRTVKVSQRRYVGIRGGMINRKEPCDTARIIGDVFCSNPLQTLQGCASICPCRKNCVRDLVSSRHHRLGDSCCAVHQLRGLGG